VDIDGMAPVEVRTGDSVTMPAIRGQRIAKPGDADLLFLAVCTPRFVPACLESLE
jgi:hypothetical protein